MENPHRYTCTIRACLHSHFDCNYRSTYSTRCSFSSTDIINTLRTINQKSGTCGKIMHLLCSGNVALNWYIILAIYLGQQLCSRTIYSIVSIGIAIMCKLFMNCLNYLDNKNKYCLCDDVINLIQNVQVKLNKRYIFNVKY